MQDVKDKESKRRMSTGKIMVVEDDLALSAGLCFEMDMNGYLTVAAYNIKKARQLAEEDNFDLVILDVNLPDGNGFDFCRELKERDSGLPVIFLTANDLEDDVVTGFDLGADDYVTKPFYMGELQARIRAALRKRETYTPDKSSRFEQGDLSVDFEKRQVKVAGEEIHLTPIEYRILTLLIANRGKVLTHNYILKEIWGYAEGVEAGTLRVFVATLRRKIEKNPSQPQHIVTEVGVGYRFR